MDLATLVQKHADTVQRKSKPPATEVVVIAYAPSNGGHIAVGARVTSPKVVRALLERLLRGLDDGTAEVKMNADDS